MTSEPTREELDQLLEDAMFAEFYSDMMARYNPKYHRLAFDAARDARRKLVEAVKRKAGLDEPRH